MFACQYHDGAVGLRMLHTDVGIPHGRIVTPFAGLQTPPSRVWTGEAPGTGPSMAGLTLGGVIVIIGIVVAIAWSVLWGVIIALIGLLAFGGFARGRWY